MSEKQTIRNFLTTLMKKDVHVGDDDSLLAAKLIDSLKFIELIMFVEEQYQVTFDSDDLTPDNFDTINAIVNLLALKGTA